MRPVFYGFSNFVALSICLWSIEAYSLDLKFWDNTNLFLLLFNFAASWLLVDVAKILKKFSQ